MRNSKVSRHHEPVRSVRGINNMHENETKTRSAETALNSKQNFLLPLILLAGFILAYYPVLIGLVNAWKGSDEYSHGFLIIPISAYIIWQKKNALSRVAFRPSWIGIIVVVTSLLIYTVARYADILTLAPVAMVLSLFGLVLYLYGFPMFKELFFPLCFLFFMMPVPAQVYSALTIPLQLLVSKVSVGFTHLLDLPVLREGNVIHLPDQTLQVVQACSGLRSMISLLMLSAVFGYLTLHSNILRGILFVSGVPVAVFVNIIRVVIMILAFHYFKYDLTEGAVHTVFGVVIFALALISIAFLKGVLGVWDKSVEKG